MPDAPARRFRFSLITLIVAVNVAGVLLWVNWRVYEIIEAGVVCRLYGWPRVGYVEFSEFPSRFFYDRIMINLGAALAIILVAGLLTEIVVRRMDKKQRVRPC